MVDSGKLAPEDQLRAESSDGWRSAAEICPGLFRSRPEMLRNRQSEAAGGAFRPNRNGYYLAAGIFAVGLLVAAGQAFQGYNLGILSTAVICGMIFPVCWLFWRDGLVVAANCDSCKQPLVLRRAVPGSSERRETHDWHMSMTEQKWKEQRICLGCWAAECIVAGCASRATVVVPHYARDEDVLVPNDSPLCDEHGRLICTAERFQLRVVSGVVFIIAASTQVLIGTLMATGALNDPSVLISAFFNTTAAVSLLTVLHGDARRFADTLQLTKKDEFAKFAGAADAKFGRFSDI